jgi:chemotaxis protein MotC
MMSGGPPQIGHRLIDLGAAVPLDASLLRGVVAYSEGRNAEAKTLLDPIDPRSQHATIAAPLALIQAGLAAPSDSAKAMALLDFARLLAPGTLIEESALRREIAAAGAAGDQEKFRSLCLGYMRRFQDSVYAGAFRSQFADLFLQLDSGEGEARLQALDDMLAELRPHARRTLYLSVSRAALLRGETGAARHAAERAAELAGEGSDTARANLYAAAAGILDGGLERAVLDLEAVDSTGLTPEDAGIREAALALAGQITAWPTGPEEEPPPDIEDAPAREAMASIIRTRAALAEIDMLLEARN